MQPNEVEAIARIAHEVNRAYCKAIGDDSQVSWFDAPKWQKDSAVIGVNFHLANPDATPADSHKRWLQTKIKEGWCWGPEKDAETKEHPCIMEYEDLPTEQRVKDYLFKAVVGCLRPLRHVELQGTTTLRPATKLGS